MQRGTNEETGGHNLTFPTVVGCGSRLCFKDPDPNLVVDRDQDWLIIVKMYSPENHYLKKKNIKNTKNGRNFNGSLKWGKN